MININIKEISVCFLNLCNGKILGKAGDKFVVVCLEMEIKHIMSVLIFYETNNSWYGWNPEKYINFTVLTRPRSRDHHWLKNDCERKGLSAGRDCSPPGAEAGLRR